MLNQDGVSDAPTRKQQVEEYRAEARKWGEAALDEMIPLGMAIGKAGLRASKYSARYKTMDSAKAKELWKVYDDLNTKAAKLSAVVHKGLLAEKWYPDPE